jgi:hypothetical protein
MKKAILYLSSLMVFFGCQDLAIKEKIIENYYLVAADDSEGTTLSYHDYSDGNNYSGIIEATVFAVGYNDNYLIIKQHPCILPNPPDKTTTNYYILPLKKGMDWRTKNGLIGPLTLEQFNEQRKELHIGNEVTFTKVIEDLQ